LQLKLPTKPGVVRGNFCVFADSIKATEDVIKFQITGDLISKKIMCFGTDNPYLLIERSRSVDKHDFVRVLKTSYKFETREPWWDAY
jgi:hypothetical protein